MKTTKKTLYSDLFDAQEGRCAICRKRSPSRKFDQDHDHAIEKVHGIIVIRGLLCRRCNRALGGWEYSNETLANAIHYMERIIELRKEHQIA